MNEVQQLRRGGRSALEGIAVDPLLAECELEAHDFGQAKLDK